MEKSKKAMIQDVRAYQSHDPHLCLPICSGVASVQAQETRGASVQTQKAWGRQRLGLQNISRQQIGRHKKVL